jgi:hypothetical protein
MLIIIRVLGRKKSHQTAQFSDKQWIIDELASTLKAIPTGNRGITRFDRDGEGFCIVLLVCGRRYPPGTNVQDSVHTVYC